VDVPEHAVLEQPGSNEEAMIGRFLDKGDHRGQPGRGSHEAIQARVVKAHRDLSGEVLQKVSGQAELGKHDEIRALAARVCEQLDVALEVLVERAKPRGNLGERDPHGLHAPRIREPSAAADARLPRT
jgi:hypothetical protein